MEEYTQRVVPGKLSFRIAPAIAHNRDPYIVCRHGVLHKAPARRFHSYRLPPGWGRLHGVQEILMRASLLMKEGVRLADRQLHFHSSANSSIAAGIRATDISDRATWFSN